jgi:inner membrane protein
LASGFSQAVAALSIGTCFYRAGMPKRVWIAGILCSVLPDIDVVGFHFGIRYGDFWGHRGFTHSLLFAAILAWLVAIVGLWRTSPATSILWIWTYLFLATASHGFLDAMTDGGLGVAFFSPFNNDRYFFPWRPIRVSPIGVSRFFSARGLEVLQSELLWIWLPSALLAALAWTWQRRPAGAAPGGNDDGPQWCMTTKGYWHGAGVAGSGGQHGEDRGEGLREQRASWNASLLLLPKHRWPGRDRPTGNK